VLPELGLVSLALALMLALALSVLPLLGVHRNHGPWMATARPLAYAQLLMIAISYGLLTWAFLAIPFGKGICHDPSPSLLEQRDQGQHEIVRRDDAVFREVDDMNRPLRSRGVHSRHAGVEDSHHSRLFRREVERRAPERPGMPSLGSPGPGDYRPALCGTAWRAHGPFRLQEIPVHVHHPRHRRYR